MTDIEKIVEAYHLAEARETACRKEAYNIAGQIEALKARERKARQEAREYADEMSELFKGLIRAMKEPTP